MPNELKLCPFCGGKAKLIFSGHHYYDNTCKGYIIVKCQVCGATAKGVYYEGKELENDSVLEFGGEKAINAWNIRVKERKRK